MLDLKVLTAVFASLVAVAAGMNGGSIDSSGPEKPDFSSLPDLKLSTSNPLENIKKMFVERPDPENQMRAELEVSSLKDERIRVEDANLVIDNFTSLDMGARKVTSDEKIRIKDFSGSIKPSDSSKIKGTAKGFASSGVNVSGTINLEENIDTGKISVEKIEKAPLGFSEVKGELSSGSTTTTFRNSSRTLNINSFSGSLTVFPANKTVILDGKVDRFEAGSFSFGT